MKEMTNSAWAAVFIALACILACVALFSHSSNATSVITISSSIITGAFGYIQGKKDGESNIPPGSALHQESTLNVPSQETK